MTTVQPRDKKTLLFVSFSESETSSLTKVAKSLSVLDLWYCHFLVLHRINKNSSISSEFLAGGISHTEMLDIEFFESYGNADLGVSNHKRIKGNGSSDGESESERNNPFRVALGLFSSLAKKIFEKIKVGTSVFLTFRLPRVSLSQVRFPALRIRTPQVFNSCNQFYSQIKCQKSKAAALTKAKAKAVNPRLSRAVGRTYYHCRHRLRFRWRQTCRAAGMAFVAVWILVTNPGRVIVYINGRTARAIQFLKMKIATAFPRLCIFLRTTYEFDRDVRHGVCRAVVMMPSGIWFALRNPGRVMTGMRCMKSNAIKFTKLKLRGAYPRFFALLRKAFYFYQFLLQQIPLFRRRIIVARKNREIKRLRQCIAAGEGYIRECKADALILAKDSAYYPTTAFIQAAKNCRIPSAVIPYDRADSVTLANDRRDHPQHVIASEEAKEIAKKYPQWVYYYKNQPLLLVAPSTLHALEYLKLAPQNPWLYNASRADRIFLETEQDKRLFVRGGISENQLAVIGAPYMDKIDQLKSERIRLRASLCEQHGFDIEKPFVVASVSPNKISQRDVEIEFNNYHEMIDKWSTALADHLDCNLIYSLHPLTNQNEVAFMEEKGGKILRQPLEELLVVADLYVVDCSGTTRWARYAGVEVIDYDIYRYNLWFNSRLDGVCHVLNYADFVSALKQANQRLKRIGLERQQATRLPQTKPTQFAERLCGELERLLKTKRIMSVV